MRRGQADVVVVGAGIIGCAVARELAARGSSVIVVERDSPGRRATWAAAGMLSPFGETPEGPFLELAEASLQRFAAFAHALRAETGIDVEYQTTGKLHVACGAEDDAALSALGTAPAAVRFDVTPLDGAGARRLEPALSDAVTSGLLVRRDHRVNNRLLAQALLASATAAGVTFRTANPVTAIVARGSSVAGVKTASGEQIDAASIVLAAGAWSAQLDGLPRALPLRPVKGQMFAVDARRRTGDRAADPLIERVLFSSACYIIPREDGRVLVGATSEEVGFRKGPTPRGIAGLVIAAARIVPAIEDLPLVETWAGFRPATPDHLPVIGADPDLRGLIYATGHFRNGILLAPITAECVAGLIASGRAPLDLAAFGPGRFD